jgi:hypothetical protein
VSLAPPAAYIAAALAAAGTWSIEMVSAAAPPATSAIAAEGAQDHSVHDASSLAVFLRPLPQALSKLEYECDRVMILYRAVHRFNLTERTCLIVNLVEFEITNQSWNGSHASTGTAPGLSQRTAAPDSGTASVYRFDSWLAQEKENGLAPCFPAFSRVGSRSRASYRGRGSRRSCSPGTVPRRRWRAPSVGRCEPARRCSGSRATSCCRSFGSVAAPWTSARPRRLRTPNPPCCCPEACASWH